MRVDNDNIGMNNAADVAVAGIAAIRGGDTAFDLSAVVTCDSSAVAVLLAWQREAQARGARLQLSGLPADLVSLASVYGVSSLLDLDAAGG